MNPAIRRVEVVAIESDRYTPIYRERILLISLVRYFPKFYSFSAVVKLYGNHLEMVRGEVVRERYAGVLPAPNFWTLYLIRYFL